MRLGVAIPQTDIGSDPDVVVDFAIAAESTGYTHLATYDHVLGANTENRPNWAGPYSSEHCFHDTFVLFGFLAAHTRSIEFSPQVLILPQRQTALVAKQCASVDVLSRGRLRLGVGVGWNPVEYTGLNENFTNRGKRSVEQVEVMKALWTQPHVIYEGVWHTIPDAGINPLPIQRPIPVWFGGAIEHVAPRIAQLGDGWIPLDQQPGKVAEDALALLYEQVHAHGRDVTEVGVDVWVSMAGASKQEWRDELIAWSQAGVTHITLNTAFDRLHHRRIDGTELTDHLDAIREYYEAVADLL